MKKLLLMLVGLSMFSYTYGQCPSDTDIIFESQLDIDQFILDWPTCTELGDVLIQNTSVNNLLGLKNITSMQGLNVYGTSLNNFMGLEAIQSITGSLYITGNPSLYSLQGLNGIQSLWILYLDDNPLLHNLMGLNNLSVVYDQIWILDNHLSSIMGLTNLQQVKILEIGNTSITNLQGLINIEIIDYINLHDNPNLWDISALKNVEFNNGMSIINNNSLKICRYPSICDRLDMGTQNMVISNNSAGCNSIEEVQEACEDSYYEDLLNPMDFSNNNPGGGIIEGTSTPSTRMVLSPNPSNVFSSELILHQVNTDADNVMVSILNSFGNTLYQNVSAQVNLDGSVHLSHVNLQVPGVYLVKLTDNKTTITKRWIVQ